jgi:DNA-binding transcriptional regulator YdaS (Cro superfamily)
MEPVRTHPLIKRAIAKLGTQEKLARAAGVEQQTISKLLHRQRGISAELAAAIDKATSGAVPKHRLRPDIFDAPASSEAA